jgi:uncharacterized protein (TIGR02145 family)
MATQTDWKILDALSGAISNNQSKNNSSGFSALPGGYRDEKGFFVWQSLIGAWWCATEESNDSAFYNNLYCLNKDLCRSSTHKSIGVSVRLVRG